MITFKYIEMRNNNPWVREYRIMSDLGIFPLTREIIGLLYTSISSTAWNIMKDIEIFHLRLVEDCSNP